MRRQLVKIITLSFISVLEVVRKTTFIIDRGSLSTTVSIGVAEISLRDENKRADHALYNAKRHGRNRLKIQ